MCRWIIWLSPVFVLSGCSSTGETIQKQETAVIESHLVAMDISNHDIDSARLHLREAEKLAPDNPHVLAAEGYFDADLGDEATALHDYEKAMEEAPHDPEIENEYGVFLYKRGEYAKALTCFRKAAQDPQNPTAAAAYENAGLTEKKLGDTLQAEQDLTQASLEEPSFSQTAS